MITFGSLFSGIGGFDLGFERAGMVCKWQCEIDPKAREVLGHHWNVPIIEDVKDVRRNAVEPVDLICGGFPCQDLSVAGKRAGLAGERSGLWYEFARIIDELEPRYVVIENVPGLLSSERGRDFAIILHWLVKRGYGVAWRVIDAQYTGVAQRRRRVFVVASFGNGSCAEILFEREGLRWDPPTRKEAGQGTAAYAVRSAQTGSNGWGVAEEVTGTIDNSGGWNVAGTLDRKSASANRGQQANECDFIVPDVSPALMSEGFDSSEDGCNRHALICMSSGQANAEIVKDVVTSLTRLHEAPIVFDTTQVTSPANYSNPQPGDPCHPLASGAHPPAIAFQLTGDRDNPSVSTYDDVMPTIPANPMSDRGARIVAPTLNSSGAGTSRPGRQGAGPGFYVPMAYSNRGVSSGDPTETLRSGSHGALPMTGVRRLTPTECARLQGFPDDWNSWLADSSRYKQFGNAVCVNVAEFIGSRIMQYLESEH